MTLRGRRVLHFAGLVALLLGLVAGSLTLWLTGTVLEEGGGSLLRVEGLLGSLYLLSLGLLLKLRGMIDPRNFGEAYPGAGLHDQLHSEVARPARGEAGFRWLGSFAALVAFLLFVSLMAFRGGVEVPGLESVAAAADATGGDFSILGLLLVNGIQLVALHLLLSALGRSMQRGKERGNAGVITRISGAPSLPPDCRL